MKLMMVFITLLCVCPSLALSDTLFVPGNYATIQAGIDAALNGDTVLVAPGVYVENINFIGKGIIVKSSNGAASTVIDGQNPAHPDFGSVVTFSNSETRSSVLDGFTLSNGFGTKASGSTFGGGIYCNDASPTIINNIITKNSASDGAGIHIPSTPPPWPNRPLVMDNAITHNITPNPMAAGGIFEGNHSIIKNNQISNNDGWGIYGDWDSTALIQGNELFQNSSGGIYFNSLNWSRVKDNAIYDHNSPYNGAAIHCYNSWPDITGNFIHHNTSAGLGGAVFCTFSASPIMANNLFWKNTATEGGAIYLQDQGWSGFFNNTFVENSASIHGGAMAVATLSQFAPVFVWNSIFWGNSAPIGPTMVIYDNSLVDINYSNVEGGISSIAVITGAINWNAGMISQDPLFVDAPNGDFHLSQDPCQPGITNPCVDSGSKDVIYLNLQHAATRTDGVEDFGQADMGYHYGPYDFIQLTAHPEQISASKGGSINLHIRDRGGAGRKYLILGSVTGVSPGTPLPGGQVTLPLIWDLATDIIASNLGHSMFINFYGETDSVFGSDLGYFNVGPLPNAVGIKLYFAYMMFDPIDRVSNPVVVEFTP